MSIDLHSSSSAAGSKRKDSRTWWWVAAAVALLLGASAASAGHIEILPLGDSLTRGDNVVGGYRTELYHDLTRAGYSVQFDGSSPFNLDPSFPDHHEGHSGYRIDQIAANLFADNGSTGNDGGFWLNSNVQPNVILLMVGQNDYGQNVNVTQAGDRLSGLITELTAARPKANIIVSNLPVRTDLPAAEANQEKYFNPQVPLIVKQHEMLGERVTFLDLHSLITPANLFDGLHPTQAGYNKIGDAWFGAIEAVDPIKQVAVPEPSNIALLAVGVIGLVRRRR